MRQKLIFIPSIDFSDTFNVQNKKLKKMNDGTGHLLFQFRRDIACFHPCEKKLFSDALHFNGHHFATCAISAHGLLFTEPRVAAECSNITGKTGLEDRAIPSSSTPPIEAITCTP